MKMLLAFTLTCLFNNCYPQSIMDYLKIQEIEKVEISFSPDMNQNNPENKVVKTSTDSVFIYQISSFLDRLPDAGQVYKSFPSTIPTWTILVTDQNNNIHKLVYFGIKLSAPNKVNGSFYAGDEKLMEYEKGLYLTIRKFMLGDWYHCD